MRRLLSVVAARMATLAVAESMASDVAMPRRTLSRYLDLLELVFVIKRIPAWSSSLTTRAISTPKRTRPGRQMPRPPGQLGGVRDQLRAEGRSTGPFGMMDLVFDFPGRMGWQEESKAPS